MDDAESRKQILAGGLGKKVAILELEVLGLALFANIEPRNRKGFWGAWRFSVSSLAIALSDLATLVWVFLAINIIFVADVGAFGLTWGATWFAGLIPGRVADVPVVPTLIAVFTIAYGMLLSRSYRPEKQN